MSSTLSSEALFRTTYVKHVCLMHQYTLQGCDFSDDYIGFSEFRQITHIATHFRLFPLICNMLDNKCTYEVDMHLDNKQKFT